MMQSVATARCSGCFVALERAGGVCVACASRTEVWSALRRGTTLAEGRYVLGNPLGDPGGFGITYFGWDFTLERRVAVKEFYPRFLQPVRAENGTVSVSVPSGGEVFAVFLSGFLEEGRKAAAVGHEHVVKILDFLQAYGTGYLIMPYYEGETLGALHDRRGGGPIPWREGLALTLPIVDALRAVHEVGVIHRDVKPANIYLANATDGPRPILLDFGAARVAGSARQFTTVLTERYAPLEQYDAEAAAQGPWTDVYAIAATILELLTGQALPPAPSRQLGGPLPDLAAAQPGAPRLLAGALDRALRLDPAERTREAKTLYAELRRALDKPTAPKTQAANAPQTTPVKQHAPAVAPMNAPATNLVSPGTRPRRWMPIAGGAIVAIVGVASLLWMTRSSPSDPSPAASSSLPTLPPAPVSTTTSITPAGETRQPSENTQPTLRDRLPVRNRPPKSNSAPAVDRRAQDRDSAATLLERADYTGAWLRATRAGDAELLKRITDACRGDSLMTARRNVTIVCPH